MRKEVRKEGRESGRERTKGWGEEGRKGMLHASSASAGLEGREEELSQGENRGMEGERDKM